MDRPMSADESREYAMKHRPMVTLGDVKRDLVAPAGLEDRLERWKSRYQASLVNFVTKFQHETLFSLESDHVLEKVKGSTHALGDVQASENIDPVKSTNPPWAMEYLLHDYIETNRAFPSWDEFAAWIAIDRKDKWYAVVLNEATAAGLDNDQAHRAMRWRLGNAWQSMARHTYMITSLRSDHGIPVKYHMLSHVLLRVDAWMENRIVYMYMPNPHEMHKQDPRHAFVEPTFETVPVEVERSQGYGKVWMPSREYVERVADFLVGVDSP